MTSAADFASGIRDGRATFNHVVYNFTGKDKTLRKGSGRKTLALKHEIPVPLREAATHAAVHVHYAYGMVQIDPVGAQRRLPDFEYRDAAPGYFVTICAERPLVPFTDPALAEAVIGSLHWLRREREVELYAYCLMPDHLHLLLRLGSDRWMLGELIGAMKSWTTRGSWRLGYQGKLWQDRFYDRILRRSNDAAKIGMYILRNPVRKGLVASPDDYPYSGLPDPF